MGVVEGVEVEVSHKPRRSLSDLVERGASVCSPGQEILTIKKYPMLG